MPGDTDIRVLMVTVMCGKEACQTSVYYSCRHVTRKPLSNDFYCNLFHANLEGGLKQNPSHSYFETKRCKQCIEAENMFEQALGVEEAILEEAKAGAEQ